MNSSSLRVCIVGCGGVGGFLAARLSLLGAAVTVQARGATAQALRDRGITLIHGADRFTTPVAEVVERPDKLVSRPDVVMVCTKAWQVADVAREFAASLTTTNPIIVTLQNGVDAPEDVAQAFSGQRAEVIAGAIRIIALQRAPATIEHVGVAPHIEWGPVHGPVSARLNELGRILEQCGVRVTTHQDPRPALWRKLLFMSSWSSVAAASGLTVGELRSNPRTRELLVACLEEVRAVGVASGVALTRQDLEDTIRFIDALPAEGTPSMARDISAGRPSELEAQTGAVVRRGRAMGVPVPHHQTLYSLLEIRERGARMTS